MWCNHQAESTVERYISLPDAIYFYLAARDTNLHETPSKAIAGRHSRQQVSMVRPASHARRAVLPRWSR